MRLGISSYTYTWAVGVPGHAPAHPMGVLDLVNKATERGVHVVQIADNLPLDRLSPSELDALAQCSSELDVGIEVGTRGINPDHLRMYLGIAQSVRSPLLRVVIDTPDHHPAASEVASTVRELVPTFERAGVILAIENHDRFNARTLAQIMQVVASDYAGICLDTANSFGALEGPEVVVATLSPWVVNVHVKDFDVFRANHNMGFVVEGRPMGRGRLDVSWLLKALRKSDRDFNAILELWTPWEKNLETTIIKEDAWATSSVAYLRQFVTD